MKRGHVYNARVLDVSILPVSAILILNFGTVPTACRLCKIGKDKGQN